MAMPMFPQMTEVPRVFTLEEANALVPSLQVEFGRLARLRAELAPLIESMGGPEVSVGILERGVRPEAGREADGERLKHLAAEIVAAVGRIDGLGCVVKDLDAGLVDFLSVRGEQPVYLCWQFGEPAVAHWHPVDEGFAGRQPIEGVAVAPPRFVN